MKRTLSNVLVIVGVVIMVAAFFVFRMFPELVPYGAPLWRAYMPAWIEGVGGMLLVAGLSFRLVSNRDDNHGFMVKLSRNDAGVSDDAEDSTRVSPPQTVPPVSRRDAER